MDVKIEELEIINKDERGETFHIRNERSGDYILAYRKAGTSSGRHYHEGKSANKDPEILYLLSGKAKLRWRKLADREVKETIVQAPKKISFQVYIWHELRAITDCSFWEMNSLEDVKKDSIRVEEK